MSEYYKSLITDDEVIRELLKESKRREGRLPTEATRLKPNLNFFQRTVSSLVSNNTRIDKSQDTFKTDYLKDCNIEKQDQPDDSPKTPANKSSIDYAFERDMVLKTKINFLRSSETLSGGLGGRNRNKIEIKKIQFGRALANTSNTANNKSNIKASDSKYNKVKQLSSAISNGSLNDTDIESATSESSSDLILLSNDKARKTTCKSISICEVKTKTVKKNDVILISSDDNDGSTKLISSSSEDKKVKKNRTKKRKKEVKDQSDGECRKKTKKKRNKRKKKKLPNDK